MPRKELVVFRPAGGVAGDTGCLIFGTFGHDDAVCEEGEQHGIRRCGVCPHHLIIEHIDLGPFPDLIIQDGWDIGDLDWIDVWPVGACL